MRFPILSSIRSNDSTVRQAYDSFDDEEESLPPPPPPLSAPPSPQCDPSSIHPWSPDDVSAMTAPSGLGTMANAEAVNAGDRLPSKQSQGERYVDGVGAVELELAIYERLEKARKVECDLAKDEQNRSDSRKQKLCIVAMLLLAILALAIGLTRGIDQQPAGVGTSNSSESKLNHPSTTKITVDDPVDSSEVKTDGPFTRDDLSIMLVGLPSETDLTSEATHILEGKYCSFFEEFYKEPRELDWLRSNIDITECSVEVLEIKRRRLNEDMSTGGLVVELNQTLMLEYPNTGNFTLTKASIDYVVSAPFKDDIAVASFVKNLKNQSSTDEFSSLKDILFAPQSTATADSQAPVSLPTVATQSPSKIPSIGPITSNPTKAPTPKPTDLPRKDDTGKDDKGKDKKKDAKGKI